MVSEGHWESLKNLSITGLVLLLENKRLVNEPLLVLLRFMFGQPLFKGTGLLFEWESQNFPKINFLIESTDTQFMCDIVWQSGEVVNSVFFHILSSS